MRAALIFYLLVCASSVLAQPNLLDIGMRRNTSQTLMGKAKIDSYKKEKTVYTYPDAVFFTIEFDVNDLCKGFFWSGKNKSALLKTIEENGFAKRDSVTYASPNLPGVLKREEENSQVVFRFVPGTAPINMEGKKVKPEETLPPEKPFYGFTIFGSKVWKKKEK